jgi:hypothetical protein
MNGISIKNIYKRLPTVDQEEYLQERSHITIMKKKKIFNVYFGQAIVSGILIYLIMQVFILVLQISTIIQTDIFPILLYGICGFWIIYYYEFSAEGIARETWKIWLMAKVSSLANDYDDKPFYSKNNYLDQSIQSFIDRRIAKSNYSKND